MSIRIRKSITIAASQERLFDLTQDYDRRLRWDTFLKKAELLNGSDAAVGVRAWCVSKYGIGMETEYVSFNRPAVTAVKMTNRSWLFKNFAGSWNFERLNSESTKVIFTYAYSLKFPCVLVSPLVSFVLKREVNQRLHDLKRYCATRFDAPNP